MGIEIKEGKINFRNRHHPSHHTTSDKWEISIFRKLGIICFLQVVHQRAENLAGVQFVYLFLAECSRRSDRKADAPFCLVTCLI